MIVKVILGSAPLMNKMLCCQRSFNNEITIRVFTLGIITREGTQYCLRSYPNFLGNFVIVLGCQIVSKEVGRKQIFLLSFPP